MVKVFLIIILTCLLNKTLNASEISGIPKVIDGDTVHINNKKIRLEGIDAPEIRQQCKKPFLQISALIGFSFNKNYSCGIVAKTELANKINNSKIKCITSSKDRYKRFLATCFKDKINLNKWMVRNGYAVAYKRYSNDYLRDEEYAKENKLGVWEGSFTVPEKWRKLN